MTRLFIGAIYPLILVSPLSTGGTGRPGQSETGRLIGLVVQDGCTKKFSQFTPCAVLLWREKKLMRPLQPTESLYSNVNVLIFFI